MTHYYAYPRVTPVDRRPEVRVVRPVAGAAVRRSQRNLVEASLIRVPKRRAS